MRLSLFRKVCLTVMGVGVVGSLVSVGTFATFTATTTNPNNSFTAGTLKISTTTTNTNTLTVGSSTGTGLTGPNITSGGTALSSGTDCGKVIASACTTLIATSRVTSEGMEPGQYAVGTIQITNDGTLPAAYYVQIQNASVTNLAGPAGSATTSCPTDIGSSPATAVLTGGCAVLGNAINVKFEDTTGSQCIFGKGANPSASAPTTDKVAFTGLCDDPTANTTSGLKLNPNTTQTPNNPFTNFVSRLAPGVYIPGNQTTTVTSGSTQVTRWGAGQSKTFNLVLAFPDQGVATTSLGSDTITIGNDNIYQGASLSFDLVWYAQQ